MSWLRQNFHVYLSTELWENRLYLTTAGQERDVPANAMRGHWNDVVQVLRFDSDNRLNDSERNPVEIAGQVVLIRSTGEVGDLLASDAQGKIVFLDNAVIGIDLETSPKEGRQIVTSLIDKGIAGLGLVMRFTTAERSYGKLVGDGNILEGVTTEAVAPTLHRQKEITCRFCAPWLDTPRTR